MPNRLQFEQSPYLLQHRENPVDWRPWGSEAFQTAREEDKPVFLSIGYSTCHWCHVMAHESFEDETVAEAINRDFIPIKVDREERPDVDAVYMAACVAMTGSGGWPLTVLLTPEQKPFWAGTYLPRQALLSLLQQAARLWREDRGSLLTAGEALTDRLREAEGAGTGFPDRALAGMAAGLYARSFDTRWGGFGHAPKFPTPHNLIFLLRYARRTGEAQAGPWRSRRWRACTEAACSTMWAAALPGTLPMKCGWCPTLKRCSMTTPCWHWPIRRPISRPGARSMGRSSAARWITSCGSCVIFRADSTADRTRTARARRGNTMYSPQAS